LSALFASPRQIWFYLNIEGFAVVVNEERASKLPLGQQARKGALGLDGNVVSKLGPPCSSI
jgi:hypothetical protein